MFRMAIAFCSAVLAFAAPSVATAATVPFVGCPSDGQIGPDSAPKGNAVHLPIEPRFAARLAFYKSKYDEGVLAPRGWHCANLEGSNGWFTVVAAQPIKPSDFLGGRNGNLNGPAIQLSASSGATSGRFEIARLIARYFPRRHAFLQGVMGEKIEPESAFPSGPYAADRLVSRTKNVVEYLTPARARGLGTASRLDPSDLPIRTLAAVVGGDDDDLMGYVAAVRLPKDMEDLAPVIINWVKHQYADAK